MSEKAYNQAIDLRFRFWHELDLTPEQAKEAALIAVDLVIGAMPKYPSKSESIHPNIDAVTHWVEVKQEIQNLE